jgi:hypothetical protein
MYIPAFCPEIQAKMYFFGAAFYPLSFSLILSVSVSLSLSLSFSLSLSLNLFFICCFISYSSF